MIFVVKRMPIIPLTKNGKIIENRSYRRIILDIDMTQKPDNYGRVGFVLRSVRRSPFNNQWVRHRQHFWARLENHRLPSFNKLLEISRQTFTRIVSIQQQYRLNSTF